MVEQEKNGSFEAEEPEVSAEQADCQRELEEGSGHIKFGVGVGAVSAASLAIIGTTCPLCWFVAPAMVAAGVHKRHQAKKKLEDLVGTELPSTLPSKS